MITDQEIDNLIAYYGTCQYTDARELVKAAYMCGYEEHRVKIEEPVRQLLSTLNTRGELNPGGHDFNTEKARAYHRLHKLVYSI